MHAQSSFPAGLHCSNSTRSRLCGQVCSWWLWWAWPCSVWGRSWGSATASTLHTARRPRGRGTPRPPSSPPSWRSGLRQRNRPSRWTTSPGRREAAQPLNWGPGRRETARPLDWGPGKKEAAQPLDNEPRLGRGGGGHLGIMPAKKPCSGKRYMERN